MEKLNEFERASIYAAMAAMEDDAEDEAALAKPLIRPQTLNFQGGQFVDIDGVQVATMAYVRRLEQIVQRQEIMLKRQERNIRSLEQSLRQQRTIVNNHSGRFGDIQRDMDGKLDRRDW